MVTAIEKRGRAASWARGGQATASFLESQRRCVYLSNHFTLDRYSSRLESSRDTHASCSRAACLAGRTATSRLPELVSAIQSPLDSLQIAYPSLLGIRGINDKGCGADGERKTAG